MAKKKKRAIAALKTTTIARIGNFLIRVRGISKNIDDHSTVFVTPDPTVMVVNGHISDLQETQDLMETHRLGGLSERQAGAGMGAGRVGGTGFEIRNPKLKSRAGEPKCLPLIKIPPHEKALHSSFIGQHTLFKRPMGEHTRYEFW